MGVVWNGPLVGSGTLTKNSFTPALGNPLIGGSAGNGSLTLATDSPNFSGGVVLRTGLLTAASALKLGDDVSPTNTLTLNGGVFEAGATFSMNRAVSIGPVGGNVGTHGFDLTFAGAVTGTGRLTKFGAGTLTLSGANNYTGGNTVQTGTLVSTHGFKGGGSMTIASGAKAVVPASSPSAYNPPTTYPSGSNAAGSKVSAITINGTGQLDLGNNDLVIDHAGTSPLDNVRNLLAMGYDGGEWDGPGIISSTALSTDPSVFALGYAENADLPSPYGSGASSSSNHVADART